MTYELTPEQVERFGPRRYRLEKVRDLTPAEERTRYESHAWSPRTDGDDEECVACGVNWQDCDDECPGVIR